MYICFLFLLLFSKQDDTILKENTHVSDCVMDVAKNEWAENMEVCKQQNITSTDDPVPKLYEEQRKTLKKLVMILFMKCRLLNK